MKIEFKISSSNGQLLASYQNGVLNAADYGDGEVGGQALVRSMPPTAPEIVSILSAAAKDDEEEFVSIVDRLAQQGKSI